MTPIELLFKVTCYAHEYMFPIHAVVERMGDAQFDIWTLKGDEVFLITMRLDPLFLKSPRQDDLYVHKAVEEACVKLREGLLQSVSPEARAAFDDLKLHHAACRRITLGKDTPDE